MKYNLEHILKTLSGSTPLTSRERTKMSHVVSEYMKMKPIPASRAGVAAPVDRPVYFYALMQKPVAWLVIVGMFVSGGGVSFAAEKSVPGDVLYPIKIGVNEEVRSVFTVTPEHKAAWEAARAERRLNEAATLAVSGKLDEPKRKDIEARFEKHAARATADAETLGETDTSAAVDFAANFETRLAAHEALLNEFAESGKLLGPSIRGKAAAIAAVRIRAEGKFAAGGVFTKTAPQAVPAAAQPTSFTSLEMTSATDVNQEVHFEEPVPDSARHENGGEDNVTAPDDEIVHRARVVSEKVLADAVEKFTNKSSRLSDADQKAGTAIMRRAQELFTEADRAREQGDEAHAIVLFRESLALSQKLIVFLRASLDLDIRIVTPSEEVETESDEDPVEHLPSLEIR